MKNIVILGSTGSIGKQTVEVIKAHPLEFRAVGLSGRSNVELLVEQARDLKPVAVAMSDPAAARQASLLLKGTPIRVLGGTVGLEELAVLAEARLVVNALVGSAGLLPTLRAISAGKDLALANKESLVAGGELVVPLAKKRKTLLIPVDSEHNALFQCLLGEEISSVRRVILTGSGGPFRGKKKKSLQKVTVEEALAHPRWKMGRKITVDSATLMNKGLEVIEAHHLFGMPYEGIEVVIHPQSILHSLVEFVDGSLKAHLGFTDMRIPIQFALTYPERLSSSLVGLDLAELGSLAFEAPDWRTFNCLALAFEAGIKGGTYPAVLNAANEEAVAAFLARDVSFLHIPEIVEEVLSRHRAPVRDLDFSLIQDVEDWARTEAGSLIGKKRSRAKGS
jgi:1-deoxy-D-xylulose-5-phosphate reductoisomerase